MGKSIALRTLSTSAFVTLTILAGLEACTGFDAAGSPPPADGGREAIADQQANPTDARNADVVTTTDGPNGGPSRGCESLLDATFCDNFDETLALHPRWQAVTFGDGGTEVRVEDGGLSAPHALGAKVSGSDLLGANITTFVNVKQRLRVRGDFRIPSFGTGGPDYVVILAFAAPTTPMIGVRVTSYPAAGTTILSVVDNGTGIQLASRQVAGVSFSDWTPLDLEVLLVPTVSVSLRVADGAAGNLSSAVDAGSPEDGGIATVRAGIPLASSTSGETRVLVDNLAAWVD